MSLAKHSYLYTAFCIIVYLLLPNIIKFFAFLLMVYWYFKNYRQGWICFCILFLLLTNQKDIPFASRKIVRVDEIKEDYVIASSKKEKSILYGVDQVSLMDIIEIEGTFKPIHTTKNLGMFHFDKYCKRKGISAFMQVDNYEIISTSNSIKAKVYKKVMMIDDETIRTLLLKVLYRNDQNEDASHLIYASGAHLVLAVSMLANLLKVSKQKFTFFICLLYYICFPFRFFAVRLLITSFIHICFNRMHKKDQLGLSMIGMILYDNNCIYEIGFIIPVIFRILQLFNISKISMRIVMFFAIIPLQLYFFNEVNLLEVVCFKIMSLLGALVLLFSIPAIYFPIFQILLHMIGWAQEAMIGLLSKSFIIYGKLSLLVLMVWLYFLIQMISAYQNKQCIILIVLLILHMNMFYVNPVGEVSFIDVGQGDCILIKEPFGKSVTLIDVAGALGTNLAEKTIYPYLKARGISHIDKIVITHDDYDHNGSLKQLQKLIDIKEIIKSPQDVMLSNSVLYSLNDNNDAADTNDQSIVLYGMINNLKYMFMGDASIMVEASIMDKWNKLSCDVLKVGHHGSNTSTSKEFVMQMHPLISVISSGYQNRYGHPHKEVLQTLKKSNTYIANTQNHGSISILYIGFINILIQADGGIAFI